MEVKLNDISSFPDRSQRLLEVRNFGNTQAADVSHPRDDRAVRQRLKEIATTRVRYGFERIQVLLRREGWRDNHKRTYRIYKKGRI